MVNKTIEEAATPATTNPPFEIKKGYNYSWDQYCEFIGTSDVLIMDGVEFPQNCTLIPALPEKTGFITHFDVDANKWIHVEDVRGKEMYNTQTKEMHYCYHLRIPAGWTFIPYNNSDYDKWNGSEWEFDNDLWSSDMEAKRDVLISQISNEIDELSKIDPIPQDEIDYLLDKMNYIKNIDIMKTPGVIDWEYHTPDKSTEG